TQRCWPLLPRTALRGGNRDPHRPSARRAFDLDLVELGLQGFHLGLKLRRLLHQGGEIGHRVTFRRLSPAQKSSSTASSAPRLPNAELSSSVAPASGSPAGPARTARAGSRRPP